MVALAAEAHAPALQAKCSVCTLSCAKAMEIRSEHTVEEQRIIVFKGRALSDRCLSACGSLWCSCSRLCLLVLI